VGFAVIGYLTKDSGSAAILSMAALVGMFPQVVLGPFYGRLGGPLEQAQDYDHFRPCAWREKGW
jgi:hypothetical protein